MTKCKTYENTMDPGKLFHWYFISQQKMALITDICACVKLHKFHADSFRRIYEMREK